MLRTHDKSEITYHCLYQTLDYDLLDLGYQNILVNLLKGCYHVICTDNIITPPLSSGSTKLTPDLHINKHNDQLTGTGYDTTQNITSAYKQTP